MTKIKQSPKLPAEQRRGQLLEAACKLFMKKGYRGSTTEEIARSVGLTKGALYFHFRSKEDILFELVRSIHEQVIKAFDDLPDGGSSPAEILKALMTKKRDAEIDLEHYLDFWMQALRIPKIRKHIHAWVRQFNDTFAQKVDRRYAPTKRDRYDLAVLVFSIWDGLNIRKMLGDSAVDLSRQLKLFARLIEFQPSATTSNKI